MATKKYLDNQGVLYFWNKLKAFFVQKEDGKGLSTNDYTTAEKNKLSGLNNTEVINNLSSDSTTAALSAAQGKALKQSIDSITGDLGEMGGGDMMKASYDSNNNGVVDDAEKLGGQLPSYYAPASSIPTNNNQLTNGAGYQNASQVDAAIASKGYQTEAQVSAAIATAVANADHLKRIVISGGGSLPTVSNADLNAIYMLPITDATGDNKFTEWMVINGAWEKTGSSDVNLNGYVQESELSSITNSEIDTIVAS